MTNKDNYYDGIINACAIKGDGSQIDLQEEAISKVIKDKDLAWVHLDGNKEETRKWLKAEIGYLDNIIINALLADETRPRIMEFEQGSLLILRGVNLNKDSRPEDMISIRLWIDEHRIISVQRRPLKAVKDIQQLLIAGKGPKNSGDFIALLAARLFERMEPVFTDMDETLDTIEEAVIEDPDISERKSITEIRKKAIVFRRYIAPQRDVIMHLRTSSQLWLSDMHKRKLQESLDRVIRYVEDLDTIRERAQIVKDELSSVLADKMNKNMYVLSVIAAIFLPLGFFTGLMGINIGGMPGVDNGDAFWIFSAILVAIVAVQVLIFRKLKWF
jgi:zinc transporter